MNAERVAEGLLVAGALAVAAGVWLLAGLGWALVAAGMQSGAAGILIARNVVKDAGP